MPGPAIADCAHRLCHHVHLLEVDEAVQTGFVALVRKSHVLEQQRNEGDDGRLQLAHEHAIRAMVAARIDQRLEFCENLTELGRNLVPRLRQPRHRHIGQTHHDGEERVQVLVLFAAG